MQRRSQAWQPGQKSTYLNQLSEGGIGYNLVQKRGMKPVKVATEEVHFPPAYITPRSPLAPLAELWAVLRGLGVVPYVFDETLNLYVLRWRSAPAVLTIITTAYLTVATVAGVVGLMMTVATPPVFHTDEEEVKFIWQMMVVVLFGSMLLNAWSETISMLFAGHRVCRLLNSWLDMESWSDISPARGLKARVRLQLAFMIGACVSILGCVLGGFPHVFLIGLDGVASILFVKPFHWLEISPFFKQVIRVVTCIACVHFFCVFNGCLFFFTTNCYMLRNALAAWNTQLATCIEDLWRGNTSGRLAVLVQTHRRLVSLVKETDSVFGFMLQVYYASTVVTLCTEIYLLAYRMCCGENISIDGLITTAIIFIHTAALFLGVSLAAASVQEVAEESMEGLRLGLPYDAPDIDKFHRDEVVTAVTLPAACITGGKFFVINRPLIITILSAVITYFIVIVQFMQKDHKSHDMETGETAARGNSTLQSVGEKTTTYPPSGHEDHAHHMMQ